MTALSPPEEACYSAQCQRFQSLLSCRSAPNCSHQFTDKLWPCIQFITSNIQFTHKQWTMSLGNKGKPRCYMSSIAKNVFHHIWHTLKFLLCLASRCSAQCQRLSFWVATVHSTALATVPMAHGHEISQEINGCTISEQCLSKNKLTEVCDISCGIVHRFIHNLYDVWSVQFRHLLAQLGSFWKMYWQECQWMPQVLWRQKCTKQHTHFLLSVWLGRWQQLIWSSSEQMNLPGDLDTSSCKPHHWPRPILQESWFPLELLAG